MDNEKLSNDDIINGAVNCATDSLAHRMSNPKLMALRAQNPFIQILPFPNEVVTLALSANTSTDINLPEGTKFIKFSGNGEYYVSRKGNAEIPATSVRSSGDSLLNPEDCYFYVEEIRQFSVIAPLNMRLSVQCFVQL